MASHEPESSGGTPAAGMTHGAPWRARGWIGEQYRQNPDCGCPRLLLLLQIGTNRLEAGARRADPALPDTATGLSRGRSRLKTERADR